MTNELANALLEVIQADVLGESWSISLDCVPSERVNTEDWWGYCSWDIAYRTATVSVATERPDADVARTLLHEVLHLAIAPLQQAARDAASCLGSEARRLAEYAIDREGERLIVCMVYALTGRVRSWLRKAKEAVA